MNNCKLKISTGLTGKMEGMTVITSAMTNNKHCLELSKCNGSICSHCYSKNALSYRPNVRECYERNGKILSESILPENELPTIKSDYCRLESHGDLHNITHLINYINIAKHNPTCQFALWTKQYQIIKDYFKDHKQPKNMNIILSSYMLNKPIPLDQFKTLGLKVKSFTVYDKDKAKEMNINCGGRKCIECLRCYRKNGKTEIINEKLK